MTDFGELIQWALVILSIICFAAFLFWITPNPISEDKQMENCMIVNNNNTKLCKVEVEYGKWLKFEH